MIDGLAAKAYDEIEARVEDLKNEFRSGYQPKHGDSALSGSTNHVSSLDPMNAVAPDKSYYVCVDAQGRRFYTRDSNLKFESGELRTSDGHAVLGFSYADEYDTAPKPLVADKVDVTMRRIGNAHVDADGSVAYTRTVVDPRTGEQKTETVTVGRIALARFPAGTRLDSADGLHGTAPSGVDPTYGRPGEGEFALLAPKSRDLGGVDMVAGLSHLREAYLAFNAIQSAHGARGKTDKTAMDLIK
jgi:flagellar basal body rod protein FlgG